MGDRLQEAREIGNVGAVYLAMGEFDSAVDCHTQHLRLARRLGDQVFSLFLWELTFFKERDSLLCTVCYTILNYSKIINWRCINSVN